MSVIVMVRARVADPAKFRDFVQQNEDTMKAAMDDARSRGCQYHRMGVDGDYMIVVDEWESPEQFRGFFESSTDVAEVMRGAGVQGEPEVTFAEMIQSRS